jgi:hypothetical protein
MKILGLAVAAVAAQLSFASLIPIGAVPQTGTGLGNVLTVLTMTSPANSSDESGCVGAAAGGVPTTTNVCPGPGPNNPTGFTGGDEQTGAGQIGVFQASAIGLTNFANLQLIFNANEPQNAAGQAITLENLALTLWDSSGGLLGSFTLDGGAYVIADADPGTGSAGFGFELDATQTTNANFILAADPDLYIGASATASDATGSHETVFIRTTGGGGGGGGEIPEPMTFAMMGGGLLALAAMRRLR